MIDWAKIDKAKAPLHHGHELYRVRVSEICPNGFFSIVSLAEYLQETAFRHSTRLNLGMEALSNTSLAWVLARLSIFVRHYPRRGDQISVETWYCGQHSHFGMRFFRLKDENNVTIASALSTFALFDLKNRTVQEWPDFIMARLPEPVDPVIGFQRRKIARPLISIPQQSFKPRLGDIDLYNHVNNTKLIEWALSAASENVKHPFQPTSLDIVFKNECKLGDEIRPEVEKVSEYDSTVLLSTPLGKELILAHITR